MRALDLAALARTLAIALAVASGVSCRHLVPVAHPPYTITGTVTAIDGHSVQLRHKSGQRVVIAMEPATRIVRRHAPAAIEDIKPGMRVVVLYGGTDGAWIAREVRLFRDPV
jgi:hypothetical protein